MVDEFVFDEPFLGLGELRHLHSVDEFCDEEVASVVLKGCVYLGHGDLGMFPDVIERGRFVLESCFVVAWHEGCAVWLNRTFVGKEAALDEDVPAFIVCSLGCHGAPVRRGRCWSWACMFGHLSGLALLDDEPALATDLSHGSED